MSLRVDFLPEARQEYEDARRWYIANRPPGTVGRFATQVRTALRRIAANPRYGRVVVADVRMAVVVKFPYVIVYRPEPGRILVISVFHTSRDPAEWQRRV